MNTCKAAGFFTASVILLCLFIPGKGLSDMDEIQTVKSVDLQRYLGVWYELAKISNPFQKKCVKNTTAEYRLREDGMIDVINTCLSKEGRPVEARGVARITDAVSNAKLKVSFVRLAGIRLFWGDYWVIGLDADYRYAVVGEPSRKYGWILSRSKTLSEEDWMAIEEILEGQKYDFSLFVMTQQDEP